MRVHVCEARKQVFAAPVNARGVRRNLETLRRPDGVDEPVADNDRLLSQDALAGHRNDFDVDEGDRLLAVCDRLAVGT